ncbi:MAG: glycine C-acetyltransferase [Acidobacteria bacterium RBG_13_68_16]|jgi:glycine C-acetyltransferase|nr:MAG: glycine C-acetyltransferase [Acidobacteria bacterium RBG_13_68_16]
MQEFLKFLEGEIERLHEAHTYKVEVPLESAQDHRVKVAGREVVMLTSNNYLGLANHPRVRQAAVKAIERWGAGMGSVRFICGTQVLHKQLEETISRFYETDDTILFTSCWNANEACFATLTGPEDAIVSDELNHASIIDGIRLAKARRYIYRHNDMADMEAKLSHARSEGARFILAITDGVFSMEGELAPLPEIIAACERHRTLLVVDDSHATGLLGKRGRGTAEELGVWGKVPVHTGTLGKAMGSAMGGYITGPKPVVDTLRQRSRPYLFSNSLAPAVVGAALEAFRMVMEDPSRTLAVQANARYFRERMAAAGFQVPQGMHPIVPVIVGDTALALAMGKDLLMRGVYVSGFGYPVVPQGQARLRAQISAAHTREDLNRAVDAFVAVARQHGVVR